MPRASRVRRPGVTPESERARERGQQRRGARPQGDERVVRLQRGADRAEVGGPTKEIGQQGHDREPRGAHQRQPAAHPPHRGRQHDVRSEHIGGRFDTGRRVDLRDHAFESVEIPREPTGETVGQQAEGLVGRGTVVPRDPHPDGRGAGVGAVAREAAAAGQVPGTAREACILPRALGNIGLAGQRAWIVQLHRPGGARGLPWRSLSFPAARSHRTAGEVLITRSRDDHHVMP